MGEYEFSNDQNTQILDLANFMKITGILATSFGIIAIIATLLTSFRLVSLLYFIFLVIAGISFYLPTDNLKNIAKTEGNDIKELMQGFKELYWSWNAIIVILLILLILEFF